jgi:predicted DCC family thiol-disulfide oxidoreductase YuxK
MLANGRISFAKTPSHSSGEQALPGTTPTDSPVMIYDGHCGLCDHTVSHILRHDPRGRILFAANTSEVARRILAQHGIASDPPPESVIYITDGRAWQKSSAVLKIARDLGGLHLLLLPGWLVPRPLRDAIYNVIARNRYRLMGRKESCRIPSPAERARFIDLLDASQ